jgi:hypothetical protein
MYCIPRNETASLVFKIPHSIMKVEIGRENISIPVLETMGPHSFISGITYSKSEPDIHLDSHKLFIFLQCGEEGGGVGRNGMRRRVGQKKRGGN